jgi:hypothetical protein
MLKLLLGLFSVAAIASLAIYAVLACRPRSRLLESLNGTGHVPTSTAWLFGIAGLALLFCVYSGLDAMLWWLPSSWGRVDEDGEFIPLRHMLAGVGACCITYPIAGHLASSPRNTRLLQIEETASGLFKQLLLARHDGERSQIRSDVEKMHAEASKRAWPDGAHSTDANATVDAREAFVYEDVLRVMKDLDEKRTPVR